MHHPHHAADAVSRRALLVAGAGGACAVVLAGAPIASAQQAPPSSLEDSPFSIDPELARRIVGASHSNIDTVRSLLAERPELCNAAIDWGFGDWESALGAAAHTGRREIAELLLEHGARLDIYAAAMLGYVDIVRAAVEAQPGVQRTLGPHGITLLSHARAGREKAAQVVEYLESVGGADEGYVTVPLSEDDKASCMGAYALDLDDTHRFDIVEFRSGGIAFKLEGSFPRGLLHKGDLEFHPAGAPSVRLRFTRGRSGVESVSFNLSSPPLVARRLG